MFDTPPPPQQLDKLVEKQRETHRRMLEQLLLAEQAHKQALFKLEEEKRNHGEFMKKSDEFTNLLEQERERSAKTPTPPPKKASVLLTALTSVLITLMTSAYHSCSTAGGHWGKKKPPKNFAGHKICRVANQDRILETARVSAQTCDTSPSTKVKL